MLVAIVDRSMVERIKLKISRAGRTGWHVETLEDRFPDLATALGAAREAVRRAGGGELVIHDGPRPRSELVFTPDRVEVPEGDPARVILFPERRRRARR